MSVVSSAMEEGDGPRWMDMPSIAESQPEPIEPAQKYHDLGDLYPDAPTPMMRGDAIIHRAILHDSSGIEQLFDWIADGDVVVVELKRLIHREIEFANCIARLQELVEGDLGGSLVQVGDDRLILLPAYIAAVKGTENEIFAPDA